MLCGATYKCQALHQCVAPIIQRRVQMGAASGRQPVYWYRAAGVQQQLPHAYSACLTHDRVVHKDTSCFRIDHSKPGTAPRGIHTPCLSRHTLEFSVGLAAWTRLAFSSACHTARATSARLNNRSGDRDGPMPTCYNNAQPGCIAASRTSTTIKPWHHSHHHCWLEMPARKPHELATTLPATK